MIGMPNCWDLVEKPQQGVGIEHGLGNGEIGPRLDLLPEAVQLAAVIQRGGIQPHADHGERGRIDGLTAQVDAAVEPPLHRRHADRIGVEHARGVRIVAQFGRIAGDEEDVSHAAGRARQQVGLHADQVPIAAAKVQDRLDLGVAQNVFGRDERGQPGWPGGRRGC